MFNLFEFKVIVPKNINLDKPFIYLERLSVRYSVEMSNSPTGAITRIANFIDKFDEVYQDEKLREEQLTIRKEQLEKESNEPNQYIAMVEQARKERDHLMKLIEQSQVMI